MLPGLVGVLCVAGLPGALAYFLAPSRGAGRGCGRRCSRSWPAARVLGWSSGRPRPAAPRRPFFPGTPGGGDRRAAPRCRPSSLLTVGKTRCRGCDRRGGDMVIAAEELAFLPCYLVPALLGVHGTAGLVVGLARADLWSRSRRGAGWLRGVGWACPATTAAPGSAAPRPGPRGAGLRRARPGRRHDHAAQPAAGLRGARRDGRARRARLLRGRLEVRRAAAAARHRADLGLLPEAGRHARPRGGGARPAGW